MAEQFSKEFNSWDSLPSWELAPLESSHNHFELAVWVPSITRPLANQLAPAELVTYVTLVNANSLARCLNFMAETNPFNMQERACCLGSLCTFANPNTLKI